MKSKRLAYETIEYNIAVCLFIRISAHPHAGADAEPMLASAQAPASFDEETGRAVILVWSARSLQTHALLRLQSFGRAAAVALVYLSGLLYIHLHMSTSGLDCLRNPYAYIRIYMRINNTRRTLRANWPL